MTKRSNCDTGLRVLRRFNKADGRYAVVKIDDSAPAAARVPTELDLAEDQLVRMTRKAARLANALRDIYNEIGEQPEVQVVYLGVERDVDELAGLENYAAEDYR